MNQCQLCISYIKEIKELNQKNKALQRQILAFKKLLEDNWVSTDQNLIELENLDDCFELEREVKG